MPRLCAEAPGTERQVQELGPLHVIVILIWPQLIQIIHVARRSTDGLRPVAEPRTRTTSSDCGQGFLRGLISKNCSWPGTESVASCQEETWPSDADDAAQQGLYTHLAFF